MTRAAAQIVTQRHPHVIFKKFSTFAAAQAFMARHGVLKYRVEITLDLTQVKETRGGGSEGNGSEGSRSDESRSQEEQGENRFYVVANGDSPGVYETWYACITPTLRKPKVNRTDVRRVPHRREAKAHIDGQCGVCHQAFHTREEADEWLWEYRKMQKEVQRASKGGLENLSDLANALPGPV